MNTKPSICVVICSNARGRILLQTIRNLLPEITQSGSDLLIIDQLCDHDADVVSQLSALHRENKLRWLRVAAGDLTAKRNIGLKSSHADIILFVDDDVLVPKDFINRHLSHYCSDPRVDGVTGQVFHARNAFQPPELDNPKVNSIAHFATTQEPRLNLSWPSRSVLETNPVDDRDDTSSSFVATRHFIGCNHSVRRTAALAIGGYDEQFIASSQCEDFDMSDRLADAGHLLIYDPNAWLIHLRAPSGGTRSGQTWPEWTRTANIFMYMFRHARTHHNYCSLLWRALRTGPLRKTVIMSPHAWLAAWMAIAKGISYGWRHRRFKKLSS